MEEVNWTQEKMLEIGLNEPDDFLKVSETLSRIGVASEKKRNYTNLVIYFTKSWVDIFTHFKELFALDEQQTNLSENDIARRNTIANLLKDWGLISTMGDASECAPLSQIKALSFREKGDWERHKV